MYFLCILFCMVCFAVDSAITSSSSSSFNNEFQIRIGILFCKKVNTYIHYFNFSLIKKNKADPARFYATLRFPILEYRQEIVCNDTNVFNFLKINSSNTDLGYLMSTETFGSLGRERNIGNYFSMT